MMGSREPAGEAKPDFCVISDGEAGAYCTVGLVLIGIQKCTEDNADKTANEDCCKGDCREGEGGLW